MPHDTHLHFIIWAYRNIEPETGNYIDNATFDLLANHVEEALERVRELLPGRKYRLHMVIEHFNGQPCGRA